ncbi:RagB/SusD family nutrient uptake outer membrane protein [Dinghuibacter silviterrae]|nr:RagB/SusD family nutrient uptake outer membrane protein [Dinghuibacter silviterrae]
MRKNIALPAVLAVCISMGACKKNGYLSSTVTSNLDSNAVFQDSTYAMEFLNNLYVNIGFATDPMRFNGGSYAAGLESACDEAEGPNASSSNGFTMFALGTVTPTVVPTDAWGTSYGMIRAANQYLRHLGIIPFNAQLKAETKGEARFLRAWYYFILLEHYGGIPLIGDTVYADATQISAVRSSFRACVNYIASECDSAAVALPLTQSGSNYGRASKGACLALKSRLYLYAASPLFQNGGIGQGTALDSIVAYPDADPSRWVLAANAAQAVITTGAYSLFVDSIPGKLGYGFMSIFLQRYNTEYILAHMMDPNRYLEHLWDAPSRGGSGGPHPYQELLDAFPMSNGLAITDPNSGYDPSQPYQNRDPRMGYTYMHDSTLRPQVGTNAPSPLEIYLNANVSPPVASSQDAVYQGTPTGYYINKMIDTGVIQINIPTSSRVLPLIRYAEILLNYAEATNESQGPVTTVYQAVEAIRQRAGLRPYQLPTNLSQADMRKAIQNERRIELAFEGNRFFDVRRWMIADSTDNQMMHGMEIDRSSSGTVYKEFNVRQHHFSKAMYLWPLPLSEIAKLPQLQQNPLY